MYKTLLSLFVLLLLLSCDSDNIDLPTDKTNFTLPTVNIVNFSNITEKSGNSGGNIFDDGGTSILAKGICWSTIQNPTINDNKTIDGSGLGEFISQLTELTENTAYYARTYATNSKGTAYSNELTFTTNAICNGGVYDGHLTLSTQQEVEDFGAKCYTGVAGILQIGNYAITTDPITDLSSLNTLEKINGSLHIYSNTLLTSLNGLEAITQVGNLGIARNASLISISGLSNLEEITSAGARNNGRDGPGIHIWENEAITTLDGLEKISVIGSLNVYSNPSLISIQGLKSITSLFDGINLYDNQSLTTLDGFNSLTSIGTFCNIGGSSKLSSIEGLSSVTSIGGALSIGYCDSLSSLLGLHNINNVGKTFIEGNPMLISLVGLPNLSKIDGDLLIRYNNEIVDLKGIEGTSLSGGLVISGNPKLTSLNQLNNLTSLGGNSDISNNIKITSLEGLENLIYIDGWLQIAGNKQLNNFCALTNLFTNGNITKYSIIQSNAYNPSENEIESGNCSQ